MTTPHSIQRPKGWRRLFMLSSLCCAIGLVGCAAMTGNNEAVDEQLSSLMSLSHSTTFNKFKEKLSETRELSLKEIALGVGAQGGLAWQGKHFNNLLETNSPELDAIFNFNSLLLKNGVLPPIITEGRKTWNLDNAQTIRVAEKTYVIEQQARFSGTVPNWRDYLWMDYPEPDKPEPALLPRNREEQKVWKKYIKIGWENGVTQADKIYDNNLSRLKYEMQGMLLYRKLVAQRMISAPFIATSNLGVTGGGERLNVNDQVLRITGLPSLQSDSQRWDPAVGQ